MNNISNIGLHEPQSILDSNLIVATTIKKYDIKVVDCGDYLQIYYYHETKIKKEKDNSDLELKKQKEFNILNNNSKKITNETNYKIAPKNILRSKLEC